MAEEVVEGEEPKTKKPIVMVALAIVILLLLMVIAIGATLFATGFFDSKDKRTAEEKLAQIEGKGGDGHGGGGGDAKGGGHGGDAKGGDGHGGPAGKASEPKAMTKQSPEMQRFEYRYIELEKELLANLTASKKVMQVKVAIMTRYDDRVINNIKKHEFALRSVALDVMRQTKGEEIETADFRKRLAEKIRDEMNTTLQKLEDFGGIEEIHFTSFIVQ